MSKIFFNTLCVGVTLAATILAVSAFADDRGQTGFPGGGTPPVQEVYRHCASGGYRYVACDMGGMVLNAELVRKASAAACTEGRSWGFSGTTLWVDKGCRADFRVLVGLIPLPSVVLHCASGGMRYNECDVGGPALDVQLLQQVSGSPCVKNRSFGIARGGKIWVDHGCRGNFRVLLADGVSVGGGGRQ